MTRRSGTSVPRFGIWAPVHGTRGSLFNPDDPPDASYRRSEELTVLAERLGFDSVLVAEHIVSPAGADNPVLETWMTMAALATRTSSIELIAATKPLLFHPAVLAKQAIEVDNISSGRCSINLVNGWFMPELKSLGLVRPHDERYEYGAEWLEVFAPLVAGERLSHHGTHFSIDDLQLVPAPLERRPRIYSSGESPPALSLAARHADTYLLHARSPEQAATLIEQVGASPRGDRAPLTFGTSAFVIARRTDDEADETYRELSQYPAFGDSEHVRQGTDPEMRAAAGRDPRNLVGAKYTWNGTAAGLVGSYDTVAERLVALADTGLELFLLSFQPMADEMERFAAEVMPRVLARAAA